LVNNDFYKDDHGLPITQPIGGAVLLTESWLKFAAPVSLLDRLNIIAINSGA
jgi:hypothetical protein